MRAAASPSAAAGALRSRSAASSAACVDATEGALAAMRPTALLRANALNGRYSCFSYRYPLIGFLAPIFRRSRALITMLRTLSAHG